MSNVPSPVRPVKNPPRREISRQMIPVRRFRSDQIAGHVPSVRVNHGAGGIPFEHVQNFTRFHIRKYILRRAEGHHQILRRKHGGNRHRQQTQYSPQHRSDPPAPDTGSPDPIQYRRQSHCQNNHPPEQKHRIPSPRASILPPYILPHPTHITQELHPSNVPGIKINRQISQEICRLSGAVGGIRTLVPLLTTTRFPVVLVMTSSIPLHIRLR